MRLTIAVAVLALGLFVHAAFAQNAQDNESVTVNAPALRRVIENFVHSVSATSQGQTQLARWDRRVCPMVAGLHAQEAQFVADRIGQRAASVGLIPGEPGCDVNMMIFFTPDASRLAQQFATQFGDVLALNHGTNTATPAAASLNAFAHSDKPVRWWHVARRVSADGIVVHDSDARESPFGGFEGLPIVHSSGSHLGRISAASRQDFWRVVIIVDVRRAQGLHFESLADYVSMVALAQLDPDADTSGDDTILNLFSHQDAAPQAMTAWDIAYLNGLYGALRNAVSVRQQEGEIGHQMQRSVTTNPAPTSPPAHN